MGDFRGNGSTRRPRVAVVGAGIAGLSAARKLASEGCEVLVLDKGRGPGGRAAHRRSGGFAFDHGAQYFTARDARFRRQAELWRAEGVVDEWKPRLVAIDDAGVRESGGRHERLVGVPGMNAMAKHLARDLELRCATRVDRVIREDSSWRILDDSGSELAESDLLLIALPPAQARPLLTASPRLEGLVANALLRPCWALLLGFEHAVPADFDAAFVNTGALAWVARDSSKPGREDGEAWVLHATMDWSEKHLEGPAELVAKRLLAAFAELCSSADLPPVAHRDAHRWRYAQPDPGLAQSCLYDENLRLGLAGDWCGGPRIEGAFLSGLDLASEVLGAKP